MIDTLQLAKLSREEKVQVMEALWVDLSCDDTEYPSPLWHEEVLKETASRLADGRDVPTDWPSAKRDLRERFK